MSISEMIRHMMSAGLTQRAIAEETGVTQPTIHRALHGSSVRYETGVRIKNMHKRIAGDGFAGAA